LRGSKEVKEPKKPKFRNGRHPFIKDGLGHTKGAKTNGRTTVNGYECLQLEKRDQIGTTTQPA
jgi:hypothetical protein